MNSIRKVALACMTAAMVTISVNASAQGLANQDTYFTFSQPVELPKTTLPAGTYFFQLMDSPGNRHVVKIMSQDRTKLHATLMAIPYYSTERPSDEPQVRFLEVPAAENAAASNAIKIWFYPGNTVGHEFIWPRDKAMSLARATNQPVLTTKTEAEDSELSRVDGAGIDAVVETNEPAASARTASTEAAQTQPAPQREQVGAITGTAGTTDSPRTEDSAAQPAAQPAAATRAEQSSASQATEQPMGNDRSTARTDLPNTAGALPLLALIGLGSLVGSRLLRRARK